MDDTWIDARVIGRVCRLAEPEQDVRRSISALGALDADRLDRVVGLAQAGRVGQQTARRRSPAALRSWSRVVPGMSVTIARSCPAIALRRLDFPAFGGPATTTRTPSRSGSIRGRVEPARRVLALVRRNRRTAPHRRRRHPPRRIVDRRFRLAPTGQQPSCQSLDLRAAARLRPAPARARALALRSRPRSGRRALRPRSGRSGHSRGAAGEFARLGQPQPVDCGQARQAGHRPPRGRHGIEIPRIFAGRRWPAPSKRRTSASSSSRAVRGSRSSRSAGLARCRQAAPQSLRAASMRAGPLTRMTAIAAGGRPLDKAKMVSAHAALSRRPSSRNQSGEQPAQADVGWIQPS